jgi:hypothetical protein
MIEPGDRDTRNRLAIEIFGAPSLGGPIVTAGAPIFIAATLDNYLISAPATSRQFVIHRRRLSPRREQDRAAAVIPPDMDGREPRGDQRNRQSKRRPRNGGVSFPTEV